MNVGMGKLGCFAAGRTFAASALRCWLFVVGCWLLAVGCSLLVVGCWFAFGKKAVCRLPSAVRRLPFFTLQQLRKGNGQRQIATARRPQEEQGMGDALALGKLEQERFCPVLANNVVENHVLCEREHPQLAEKTQSGAHKTAADSTALFDFNAA